MKERIEYIDATKAICMLLVILGHCYWTAKIPHLSGAIYSFHMPMFFVISGFFIKKMRFEDAWRKYSRAYLLPYMAVGVISMVEVALLALCGECSLGLVLKETLIRFLWGSGWEGGDALFSNIPVVVYLWFLLALFWACLFYSIIDNYTSSEFKKAFLIILLAIASRISVSYIRLPLSLQSGIFSLIFIYSGSLAKKYNIIERMSNLPLFYYVVITILCAFHILKCQTMLSVGKVSFDSFGIVTTLLVCCMIMVVVRRGRIKSGWLGRNTLLVLCGHSIANNPQYYSSNLSFELLPFHPVVNLIVEFSISFLAAYIIARLLSLLPVFGKKEN